MIYLSYNVVLLIKIFVIQVGHIKLNYEKWRFLLWIELIVKIGFEQQNWDHIFNYIVRSFAQGARQIGTRVREMVVDLWYVPQLRDNTFRYWFIANSSMDYRCYPKKKKKKKAMALRDFLFSRLV